MRSDAIMEAEGQQLLDLIQKSVLSMKNMPNEEVLSVLVDALANLIILESRSKVAATKHIEIVESWLSQCVEIGWAEERGPDSNIGKVH